MAVPLILSSAIVIGIARTILTGLGIGTISYVGMDTILTYATAQIMSGMGSMAAPAAGLVGLARIDEAIMIMLSAYNARLALMVLKRFRLI